MEHRYIVIADCPIERHPPGADVTQAFSADVLERLREEGHVQLEYKDDEQWLEWKEDSK